MKAWVVRGDGEPRDVFTLEEVPEPSPELLDGLKMDLAGWVTDPASLGVDDPAEHELFATRRTAAANRPPYEDWVMLRVRSPRSGCPTSRWRAAPIPCVWPGRTSPGRKPSAT